MPRPRFAAIPAAALLPAQGPGEVARRGLYSRLQQGWGTFYHRSMTTWALLPESLTFGVGLYRQSTGQYLPAEGLALAKPQLFPAAEFAIGVGPHAYNQSYAELTLTWCGNFDIVLGHSSRIISSLTPPRSRRVTYHIGGCPCSSEVD